MNLNFLLTIFTIAILTISCNENTTKEGAKPIARFGDEYLYLSEIQGDLSNLSSEDSLRFVDLYANSWGKKKAIISKAKLNIKYEDIFFEKLVNDYRDGLISDTYRNKIVDNYLDTIITTENINEFYEQNKPNFLLKQDLILLKFVAFPKNYEEKENIEKLFKSNKSVDLIKLEGLILRDATSYNISKDNWFSINDLKSSIEVLRDMSKTDLLKTNYLFKKEDLTNIYFVKILDVKKSGSYAPKSYVEHQIKNVILNKRKLELLNNVEAQIFQDAVKKRDFETYTNDKIEYEN